MLKIPKIITELINTSILFQLCLNLITVRESPVISVAFAFDDGFVADVGVVVVVLRSCTFHDLDRKSLNSSRSHDLP